MNTVIMRQCCKQQLDRFVTEMFANEKKWDEICRLKKQFDEAGKVGN